MQHKKRARQSPAVRSQHKYENKFHSQLNIRPWVDKINITQLKELVAQQFPIESPLRQVLLAEQDELETAIFISRLPIYLRLSSLKKGNT